MWKYYLTLAISILFNCTSLILLKKGALAMEDFFNNMTRIMSWVRLMLNPYMMAAVFCFAVSFVTWMISLRKLDLSLAYPLVSVSYIIIALASRALFGEVITMQRGVGMGLVMVGVAVMFR